MATSFIFKKSVLTSSKLDIDKFSEYYANNFNSKNAAKIGKHEQIEAEVNQKICELKDSKFEIKLTNAQI